VLGAGSTATSGRVLQALRAHVCCACRVCFTRESEKNKPYIGDKESLDALKAGETCWQCCRVDQALRDSITACTTKHSQDNRGLLLHI
jgi:hypothetical protein